MQSWGSAAGAGGDDWGTRLHPVSSNSAAKRLPGIPRRSLLKEFDRLKA